MKTRLQDYIKSAYPLIWMTTHEEARAVSHIKSVAEDYTVMTWNLVDGAQEFDGENIYGEYHGVKQYDPLDPIRKTMEMNPKSIMVIFDYHKFIAHPDVYRSLKNIVPDLKNSSRHIIFVSPQQRIPIELQKDIIVVDLELPTVQEHMETAKQVAEQNNIRTRISRSAVAAAKGLTLEEAENAFALSYALTGKVDKKIIENEKLQTIRKLGMLEIHMPEKESMLGGLSNLKTYIRSRKKGFSFQSKFPPPKGILLLGLPGAGKSLAAKVIASMLDMPLLRLDISALKASLVGESERNLSIALQTIDAVAPCVLWMNICPR